MSTDTSHSAIPLLSCWQCAHLEYSSGQPAYSEVTPGYEGSLCCLRGYWDADYISDFSLRDYILKAGDCEEFLDYRFGLQKRKRLDNEFHHR